MVRDEEEAEAEAYTEPAFYIASRAPGAAARAVASVREHHPLADVTVVADNFGEAAAEALRAGGVTVVENPFPGSDTLGAMRLFWEERGGGGGGADPAAAFLRDDVRLRAPLRAPEAPVAALWTSRESSLLRLSDSLAVLASLYMTADKTLRVMEGLTGGLGGWWIGCAGLCLVARRSALDRLHDGFGLFYSNVLKGVCCPDRRQGAERVVSILLHVEEELSRGCLLPSLCGDADSPHADAPFFREPT